MNLERDAVKAPIRNKVIDLATIRGYDVADLGDDDIIPATGYVDSAGILELVVWYENAYDLALSQDEINIDNLGSVNAMTDYLLKRKAG